MNTFNFSILNINFTNIDHFLHKKFSHAHGHGGQNINKSNTKVQLEIFFEELIEHHIISSELGAKLLQKYPHGFIEVADQETRSQHQNLELAKKHLHKVFTEALES